MTGASTAEVLAARTGLSDLFKGRVTDGLMPVNHRLVGFVKDPPRRLEQPPPGRSEKSPARPQTASVP